MPKADGNRQNGKGYNVKYFGVLEVLLGYLLELKGFLEGENLPFDVKKFMDKARNKLFLLQG